MSNDLKYVVDLLKIHEKKEKLVKERERLFDIKRQMSKMTFNRNVGLYGFFMDEMDYLMSELNTTDDNRNEIIGKIRDLRDKTAILLEDEEVKRYAKIRDEYYHLLFDNDYFITVNCDLRRFLTVIGVPNIYVSQGEDTKNIVYKNLKNTDKHYYLISPVYDMESLRDFRHFYNKVSFRYLEELCDDYSYRLDGKKLGKVKIIKKP